MNEYIDISQTEVNVRGKLLDDRDQELRQDAIELIANAKTWRNLKIVCSNCFRTLVLCDKISLDSDIDPSMVCVSVKPIENLVKKVGDKATEKEIHIRSYWFNFECENTVPEVQRHRASFEMQDSELTDEMRQEISLITTRTRGGKK